MTSTFSYAQAAKGIAALPSAASKATGDTSIPIKEATTPPMMASVTSTRSRAGEDEHELVSDQPIDGREPRPQRSSSNPASRVSRSVDASSVSSPDPSTSSSSTITKDDDASSIPNTSSESTWDNKSQISTSAEKSNDSIEKSLDESKKSKAAPTKPLQEAPLPVVNIWKVRADEQKAKAIQAPVAAVINGINHGTSVTVTKKNEALNQEQITNSDNKIKVRDDGSRVRPDVKPDIDGRKGSRSKMLEKEKRQSPSVLPPPPSRDQEAWPTPEIAVDEERKKAQEKGEKVEKERKDSTSISTHGKQEWKKVPYTPSVVFNTPLPNAANARRGGRPSGRGGALVNGRPTTASTTGTNHFEKVDVGLDVGLEDEQPKRERVNGPLLRDSSPKLKHADVASSPASDNQAQRTGEDASTGLTGMASSHSDRLPRRASMSSQMPGQGNSYSSKPQNSGRMSKSRRGDFFSASERRRDGAAASSKDNNFDDHRGSMVAQNESQVDGDQRTNSFTDGPNGHQSKHGRYNSHTVSRERGRGGGRGARGHYTSSSHHQFSNGHMSSTQASSTFPVGARSPTTMGFESNGFFTAPPSRYGRSGHRTHSVALDSFPYSTYRNGASLPPIQTYNTYDYTIPQPMSALPFSLYADQFGLFSLMTSQLEYYFSMDNLIKDMFLRKHMDSQGFVPLQFIAGFNRVKNLSSDLELIKHVCQQSTVIEYRTSEDGSDKLRRREDWQQWVLNMTERDESAQNEGPKELHRPPVANSSSFDQTNPSQWPISASGIMPIAYGFNMTNGHSVMAPDFVPEGLDAANNFHSQDDSYITPAMNGHSTN